MREREREKNTSRRDAPFCAMREKNASRHHDSAASTERSQVSRSRLASSAADSTFAICRRGAERGGGLRHPRYAKTWKECANSCAPRVRAGARARSSGAPRASRLAAAAAAARTRFREAPPAIFHRFDHEPATLLCDENSLADAASHQARGNGPHSFGHARHFQTVELFSMRHSADDSGDP